MFRWVSWSEDHWFGQTGLNQVFGADHDHPRRPTMVFRVTQSSLPSFLRSPPLLVEEHHETFCLSIFHGASHVKSHRPRDHHHQHHPFMNPILQGAPTRFPMTFAAVLARIARSSLRTSPRCPVGRRRPLELFAPRRPVSWPCPSYGTLDRRVAMAA